MAAQYTTIIYAEMRDFLIEQEFQQIDPGKEVKEIVFRKRYTLPIMNGTRSIFISVRVYTSVEAASGLSRGNGRDAIRVVVLWHKGERGEGEAIPIGKMVRVHRVENWRENLRNRLDNWYEMLVEPHLCPVCGAPMRLNEPRGTQKWKPFWGCIRYQKQGGGCRGTRSFEEAKK